MKFFRLIPIGIENQALSTPEYAQLFFDHVFYSFGFLWTVLYGHNEYSTMHFWEFLGSHISLLSGNYPQSDGQTRRAHHTVEQVIHCFLAQHGLAEDWWCELLGIA